MALRLTLSWMSQFTALTLALSGKRFIALALTRFIALTFRARIPQLTLNSHLVDEFHSSDSEHFVHDFHSSDT